MTDLIQLITITPKEFRDLLLKGFILELNKLELNQNKETKLLTRKETADFFKVTSQTIINWERDGIITSVDIGGVIRYKRDEVENLGNNTEGGQND